MPRAGRRVALPALVATALVVLVPVEGSASSTVVLPSSEELPASVVAFVSHVPVSRGRITQAEFRRAAVQLSASWNIDFVPKPGTKRYEKVRKAAIESLFEAVWLEGQAEAMGIAFTPRQVSRELDILKTQNFESKAEYRAFLREFRLTRREVRERVELQLFATAIQRRIERTATGRADRRRAFREFVAAYTKRWRARTVCAPEFVIDRCSNGPLPS